MAVLTDTGLGHVPPFCHLPRMPPVTLGRE